MFILAHLQLVFARRFLMVMILSLIILLNIVIRFITVMPFASPMVRFILVLPFSVRVMAVLRRLFITRLQGLARHLPARIIRFAITRMLILTILRFGFQVFALIFGRLTTKRFIANIFQRLMAAQLGSLRFRLTLIQLIRGRLTEPLLLRMNLAVRFWLPPLNVL
ncbi:hypothetical protein AOX63_08405 [Pseudomonas sp. ADP]|nr:hypothetical protein AOX63_08405 [Pseudomonas sp. ADP]OBP12048.1 hypothetical protein BAE52_06130 [Pseudomonas sp. EGD-AKN5]